MPLLPRNVTTRTCLSSHKSEHILLDPVIGVKSETSWRRKSQAEEIHSVSLTSIWVLKNCERVQSQKLRVQAVSDKLKRGNFFAQITHLGIFSTNMDFWGNSWRRFIDYYEFSKSGGGISSLIWSFDFWC